jgi:2,3-bisphosphoglycerate-independent phosphoglycerate mutase
VNSVVESLIVENTTKIVLLVLDGIGDLPSPDRNAQTPLEAAQTPHLDAIVPSAALGRLMPVAPGITPGSGPGHLALFGYDPLETRVGRGVLEALGAGIDLRNGDVAARANFCTVDSSGVVSDRRAGRISSEVCARLVEKLKSEVGRIEDVEVVLQAGKGHRCVAVLRGPGLAGDVSDADPHVEGKRIPAAMALRPDPGAQKTARIANAFVAKVGQVLAREHPANAALMRGVSARPQLAGYRERFGLRAAAIAGYPMYRGVAQLAGMEIVTAGESAAETFAVASRVWDQHDFLFVHIKGTDMAGEDGNFGAKVEAIEQVDEALPTLLERKPDVLCITGDHSTPVLVRGHSWHPVPLLVHGRHCGADGATRFHEKSVRMGSLNILASKDLMAVLLANAGRLDKFGA